MRCRYRPHAKGDGAWPRTPPTVALLPTGGIATRRALVSRSLRKNTIALTEIRCGNPADSISGPVPREDAFLVALQLRSFPVHEYWEDGRRAPVTALASGCVTLYHLKRGPAFRTNTPFHSVHFYLPRTALNALADEAGTARIADLRYAPGAGMDDPIIRALTSALRPALEQTEQANGLFVDHVMRAVATHVGEIYGGMKAVRITRGGLAPWEERRAREIIDANLDGEISLARLARECGLSTSHFSRAFRRTMGMAPHRWLLQRRVDAAKTLLRDRQAPLAEVALACGFADQSHFTRIFTKIANVSPAAWRRMQRQ